MNNNILSQELPLSSADAAFEPLIADLLESGRSVRFRAPGVSMLPLIQDGANLEVAPFGSRPARPGEIVVCRVPGSGQILVHRLLGRDGAGRAITRGDHAIKADPPHAASDLLGRVIRIEQTGGVYDLESPGWRWLNRGLGKLAGWQWALTGRTVRQSWLWPFRKLASLSLRLALSGSARLIGVGPAQPRLSAEMELVLNCLYPQFTSVRSVEVRRLVQGPGFDWQMVRAWADQNGVTPLVFSRLVALDPPLLPPMVQAEFEVVVQTHLIEHLVRTRDSLVLLNFLQEKQIPVLPFKGPFLAEAAYGDLALRRFNDLDLLIKPADVLRVKAVLLEHDFEPQFEADNALQLFYTRTNYEEWFYHPHSRLIVDLHWSLLPLGYSFSPDPALAWQRTAQVDVGTGPVETLGAETLLLFLCAHGAKHGWQSLNHVTDLAHLISSQPGLDWEWIRAQAGQLGSRRMLLLGLRLAHDLLETELPPPLLADLAHDPALPDLVATVRHHLYVSRSARPPGQPRWRWLGQYWQGLAAWYNQDRLYRLTMERRRDRWRFWRDNLLTPTPLEWAQFPLPSALFWLYYGLRPVRLLLKYLKHRRAGV